MRETKFRAFDSDEEIKKMIYSDKANDPDYFFSLDSGKVTCEVNYCYCDIWGDEHDSWKPLDNIMQYTGFKDRDGKEIYEGDIIDLRYAKNHKPKYRKIIFYNGAFRVLDDFSKHTLDVYMLEKIPVVGNIYENPELLTE